MIKIYYSNFTTKLDTISFDRYLNALPVKQIDKILRYKRWQDAHASLFGKLLLRDALMDLGYNPDLNQIKYTEYNRPYIEGFFDFNISHSGCYVVCAISRECRIGVDIEEMKQIDMGNFINQWTATELNSIINSADINSHFFELWSMKEAVIKADGKGLNIPFKNIVIHDNMTSIDGITWYLTPLSFIDQYSFYIATNKIPIIESIIKLDYYNSN